MQNMNPVTYLNVSVDHMFEQHTISNIEKLHKNLEDEIEQKKQEIRKFVGERYRDLIQAADSINDMKGTSSAIISHVNQISLSCKKLNDEQLIGFKNEPDVISKQERLKKQRFYGIMLQIKILTNIPELLWHHLDNEDFFLATQLYVFSRHITTGLQLASNSDVVQKFPVLKTIWETLTPFYGVIKDRCQITLEREDLEASVVAKCLSSILLLESCDFRKLLQIFIDGRSRAFITTLDPEGTKYEKAKEKILASLKILIKTVELMHDCFSEDGFLFQELNKLASDDATPTIELIHARNDPKMSLLPDIVRDFKPQVVVPSSNPEDFRTVINFWLEFIEKISKTQLSSLVLLITSIKTVQDVKKQTQDLPKSRNWNKICENLQISEEIDFYSRFYQDLIDKRLQEIIRNAWNSALEETLEAIRTTLSSKDRLKLKSWMWREESDDCPISLKLALQSRKDQKKLLMKVSAFTPEIVEICVNLDKKLENLFNDVKTYLNVETSGAVFLPKHEKIDEIVVFLNECSAENVMKLITEVKNFEIPSEKLENSILLARILYAMPILCPNLKSCLSSTALATTWNDPNPKDLYNKSTNLLQEESFNFWMAWLDAFIAKLDLKLAKMNKNVDLNTILKDFPCWDIITIEEKDEQDNVVQSQIRIPSKPSFPLQRFLHETCSELNDIIPHTLPKKVSSVLVEKIALILQNHYRTLAETEFVQKNQNTALQYYFDIKFVQYLLVSRENKAILEKFTEIVGIFKNFIDPFDFDVFFSYLNDNLKLAVQRIQYQLGYLTAVTDQVMPAGTANAAKQERDPNVIALSSNATNITWFPLLPISDNQSAESQQTMGLTMTASGTKLSSMTDSGEMRTTLPSVKSSTSLDKTIRTAQNYADNVKSGAAAFFGDWFKS
ncbi:conserved oligomeric Golgi complex subunit 1 [Culicoides brevitarsis]|uniref:conserved oligomeric Golgi complex subunit 1 n=1 Tax=Culicoides brevitarsis TaxID=469753 RepID=UPI00307C6691